MSLPVLRPMLPADVDRATEMVLGHGWGVRRDWLAFATESERCPALVADVDGDIVATGVGTANGPVGWIGSIFVAPDHRGHGLGLAITQLIIDRLQAAGCRTLVLVATREGRRLYERMGFEVQTQYRILQAVGLPPAPDAAGAGKGVRDLDHGDLDAILALDREGTGEDRGHVIRRFAAADTTRVLPGDGGAVDGFVIRAPWGGGATVARSPDAALRIITARRRAAGPEGRVRVGLTDENAEGLARLAEVGLRLMWSAPRMVRGEALAWQPEMIYGQFNHAMG
jgi:GNAT superfamily N-acetyltransferase